MARVSPRTLSAVYCLKSLSMYHGLGIAPQAGTRSPAVLWEVIPAFIFVSSLCHNPIPSSTHFITSRSMSYPASALLHSKLCYFLLISHLPSKFLYYSRFLVTWELCIFTFYKCRDNCLDKFWGYQLSYNLWHLSSYHKACYMENSSINALGR